MRGVYAITNSDTGRRYIGRSKCIETRWRSHKDALESGFHHNVELQRDWELHGPMSFRFAVLELCDSDEQCAGREKWYIVQGEGLYNATDGSGATRPSFYHAVKARNKPHSLARKNRKPRKSSKLAVSPKRGEAMRGRKLSAATREKMRVARKAWLATHREQFAQMTAKLKGRKRTITWGGAISAAKKNKPWSLKRRAMFEAAQSLRIK